MIFLYNLPSKIQKDIAKVQFDFENYNLGTADPNYKSEYARDYEGYCGYPVGIEVLENGLPVLFVNAGGDWENPICFCIYFDGKELRGYVPSDGNVYNKKEKRAYGSEELEECDDIDELPDGDADLIRKDVMKRIQIK